MKILQQLMHKNTPVLEVENYNVKILDYEHLPYALRYEDVNYDDIFHGWTETRMMSIGKTNAKKILSALQVPQSNMYALAKALHFVSVKDCYWINENEQLLWKDVNLYKKPFDNNIAEIALFGTEKRIHIPLEKIHTPEIAMQGFSAKAWVWNSDGLYLYKVGKAELSASKILDDLGMNHVRYELADIKELTSIINEEKFHKIIENNEQIVKCKCLCNEDVSIISWLDFAVYANRNNINDYEYIESTFPKNYYEMIIADYLLGNSDRHEENWGFLVDNNSGKIIEPYPLMDHDHAFDNDKLFCRTIDASDVYLEDIAKNIIKKYPIEINSALKNKPIYLDDYSWNKLIERADILQKEISINDRIKILNGQNKNLSKTNSFDIER